MKLSTSDRQRSSTAKEIELTYFLEDDEINQIRLRISLRFSNSVVYHRKHSKNSISAYKAIGELSLNCGKGLDLALINSTGISYDDILYYIPDQQLPIVWKFAYYLNCNHETVESAIGVWIPAKDPISNDSFDFACSRFSLDDLTCISNGLKALSLGGNWIPKIQSYIDRVTKPDTTVDPVAAKIEAEKAKLDAEKAEKAKLEAEKAKLEAEKAKATPIAISTK